MKYIFTALLTVYIGVVSPSQAQVDTFFDLNFANPLKGKVKTVTEVTFAVDKNNKAIGFPKNSQAYSVTFNKNGKGKCFQLLQQNPDFSISDDTKIYPFQYNSTGQVSHINLGDKDNFYKFEYLPSGQLHKISYSKLNDMEVESGIKYYKNNKKAPLTEGLSAHKEDASFYMVGHPNTKINAVSLNETNERGEIIKGSIAAYHSSGKLLHKNTSFYSRKYNAEGLITESIVRDEKGEISSRDLLSYNSKGQLIKKLNYTHINGIETKVHTTTFEYDEKGNWVRMLKLQHYFNEYQKERFERIERRRTYVYYE